MGVRAETPDAWDAWRAGDINLDKAERISKTLIRLVRDNSKALLNAVVVDVAVCKTGELLGRWLNQFVARIEPDQQDERIHRSLADRCVSVRPDLDGVSFLSAALSSLDAAAIHRVLTAIAAVTDPGDTRTLQQRRGCAGGRAAGPGQQRLPQPVGRRRRRQHRGRPRRRRLC